MNFISLFFCRGVLMVFVFSFWLPLHSQAQETFDPDNPTESASAPWDTLYYQYNGSKGHGHQKGPKTVLVFLVEPNDGPVWNDPPAFATLEGQLANASQHYYRASYRQTWFGPKRIPGNGGNFTDVPRLVVTPVMRLPRTEAVYKDTSNNNIGFSYLQNDCLVAIRDLGGEWDGGDLDPNNFDRWVVMSNTKLISSTGLAYAGGKFAWVGLSLDSNTALHEWGHNWGVIHANSWVVPSGGDPNLPPRSPSRQNAEYQDGYDIMGGGSTAVMFGPQFLENLGFLQRSRNEALDITDSGTYRLYAYIHPDRRRTENNTRALVIPMSSFTDWKRVIVGFPYRDSGVDGGPSRTDWSRTAVTLHSKLSNGSNLLDSTPNSQPGGDERIDSALKIGRTYSEGPDLNGTQMYGGFHLTPVTRGSTEVNGIVHQWMDVVVNYDDDITTNQAPSASFADTLITGAVPGEPFTFAVNASDPDGDALAYDWDFGDGGYSIVSSDTQTTTWAAAGMYLVTCTVSDMKGGLATAQAWVNVGNVAFREAESPASTLTGVRYNYYERSLNSLPDFLTLLPVKSGVTDTFSLAPREINDSFAFLYEGYVEVPEDDVYTFYLDSDDGSRLYIGDTLVVDNDGLKSGAEEVGGNIALDAGKHLVRVEFFHRDGSESLAVSWSTLDTSKTAVTDAMLSHTDPATQSYPTASLTAPAEGAEFLVNSDLTLEGFATSGAGIDAVRFFANGAFLGLDSTEPYSLIWEKVSVGIYELVAMATDMNGLSTVSAPVNIEVVSPPPARGIAVNVGAAGTTTTVGAADSAGAVFAVSNWNNPSTETVTNMALQDVDGLGTTAHLSYDASGSQSGLTQSNGETDIGNGRMLRGNLRLGEYVARDLALEFTDIPYSTYDVYVYFDPPNTSSHDTFVHEFVLTPDGQSPRPSVFAKNSLVNGDALGDWPGYDTWTGFREATAATHTASNDEILGNYVVFREVTTADFVVASVVPPDRDRSFRYISAVQIVETVPPDFSAPMITEHPQSETATVGSSVTFSVSADGDGDLSYQWFKNEGILDGETASTLSLVDIDYADAGDYHVSVSNVAGATPSDPATLTVEGPAQILTHPEAQAVALAASAEFSVTVAGTPPFSYVWHGPEGVISGATEATLTIPTTTESDAGSYHVVVTNGVGSDTSNSALLSLFFPPVAPSGLSATAVSHSEIGLSWTDPAEPEGPVDGFEIEVAESSSGPWSFLAQVAASPYTHSGLGANTTRFYRVRAFNDAGDGAWSATATTTTFTVVQMVLIDRTTRNGSFEENNGQDGDLNQLDVWTNGFNVLNTQHKNNLTPLPHGSWAAALGGTDNRLGVVQNTGYVVGAWDTFDLSLQLRSAFNWDGSAEFNWRLFTTDDNTNTGAVTVIASGSRVGTTSGWQALSYPEVGEVLAASEGRELWIELWSSNGHSGNRFAQIDDVELVVTAAETATPPPAPTGMTAEAVSSSEIQLAWTDAADPADPSESFRVEHSADGGDTWSTAGTPEVTSFGDSGLAVHTEYAYRVIAIRGGEESEASVIVTARTWTVHEFPDDNDDGVDDTWMAEHFFEQSAEDIVLQGGEEMTIRSIFMAALDPVAGNLFRITGLDEQGLPVFEPNRADRVYTIYWNDDLTHPEGWMDVTIQTVPEIGPVFYKVEVGMPE